MAKSPNKKGDKLVVYSKQWPDTRVDKPEIDKDEPVTPHLGHEYRLTKKFSEQTEKPKSARETFSKRFRLTRAKHMPHPAPVKGGHYKTTPQMEKPHYEETDTMTQKTYTEFVTEAAKRGRPRKLRPGEEADTLHIQDQLNKLTHPNHVEVHFKDGSKHRIPREHANMAIHHLNSLKPIERSEHAEHMSKSHSDFYHVLSKKSVPAKKKGISLAGPKLRKEEAEHDDDGWYAHKEMHGSKAISKEDWKKGVRPKKSMKKEEVEQIDEWGKKAITGPHAKTSSMAITPPKVGYAGKTKKIKKQTLDTTPNLKTEERMGFKKLKASLAHKAGIKDPSALAASIGRKKYGKEKFQKMASAGKENKKD